MSEAHSSPEISQAGDQPLVSVGLPIYNRPQGLRKVLQCIAGQTYTNLEVIISDNCSDNPEVTEILNQALRDDKRVKVFRQPENIGLERNFNFVYQHSTGPYFMWMSDDDLFDVNYIEACVSFLEQNPAFMLCSGQAIYYTNGQYSFTEDMMPLCQAGPFTRASRFFNRMQQNGKFYGVFRNKMLSAEPLGQHIGCDWSFMAKLAILGKLTFTPDTTYHRAIGGHSDNRGKIVRRYGYKGLKRIFLETYSAFVIAANIFTDEAVKKKLGYFQRTCLSGIVFVKVHWLHLVNAVRRRIKRKK